MTVPDFSPQSVAGRNTSARGVDSESNPSTAMIVSTASMARRGEGGVGEVADRIGAEQHEDADLAVGRGTQDPVGVESTLPRARPPTAR